jgi:hypothetical protein
MVYLGVCYCSGLGGVQVDEARGCELVNMKTHLWGWAFDLNINSGQFRTDEEDPKKYIDVTALTWRYGAHVKAGEVM